MAKTPNFERITATITDADIDRFLRSTAPDDLKQQVRDAPDQATKMRFVAGYLIRTKQIKPERLNPKPAKVSTKKKPLKSGSRAKHPPE